jgi:hypothetical protein
MCNGVRGVADGRLHVFALETGIGVEKILLIRPLAELAKDGVTPAVLEKIGSQLRGARGRSAMGTSPISCTISSAFSDAISLRTTRFHATSATSDRMKSGASSRKRLRSRS